MSDKTADRSDEADRDKHLEWCKQRALAYWTDGDLNLAVTQMVNDLGKHPECRCSPALMEVAVIYISRGDTDGVKRWITGFR